MTGPRVIIIVLIVLVLLAAIYYLFINKMEGYCNCQGIRLMNGNPTNTFWKGAALVGTKPRDCSWLNTNYRYQYGNWGAEANQFGWAQQNPNECVTNYGVNSGYVGYGADNPSQWGVFTTPNNFVRLSDIPYASPPPGAVLLGSGGIGSGNVCLGASSPCSQNDKQLGVALGVL